MSYSVLELVGKNLTIDLLDGVNYALVQWAPSVTARDRALIGNYSPYLNVTEVLTVNVFGESVTETLQALDDINVVLEQAESWSLGDAVEPVLMRVQLQGSSLVDPLEAVVLGRPGDDMSMVLQPTFNQDLLVYEIANVEIRLLRRGLWLGEEVERSLSGTLTNPAVMTVNMGERLNRLSPTTIRVTGFGAGTPMLGGGYMLISGVPAASSQGRNIGIYGATSMSSAEFNVVDDSANNAHFDDILRIDAAADATGTITLSGVYAEVSRVSVFAAIRNNSTTTTWRVRAKSTGYVTAVDGWQTIDALSQEPRIVYVGTLANQSGTHINVALEFEASAVSGTLDVNYVVILGHDQSTGYITIDGADYSAEAFPRALVVADRVTTHRTPLIYIETVTE